MIVQPQTAESVPAGTETPNELLPLVVDLDGTLVSTDLLHETLLRAVAERPLAACRAVGCLLRGRAAFKRALAEATPFDPSTLPYTEPFLSWLREQKLAGREIWLVTGSDSSLARAVADHLGLFDRVLATDGERNLTGRTKAQVLAEQFGARGFVYAGNGSVDVPVWEQARAAVVVNAPARVARAAARATRVEAEFPPRRAGPAWVRAIRPHQWVKNLLLFVPLVTAHRVFELAPLLTCGLLFIAFCLCASSVYLLNDLLDLDADRRHLRKRARPFAAGVLSVRAGLIGAGALLVAALGTAALLGPRALSGLVVYYAFTLLYSWRLKRLVIVDVFGLAGLYTLRVIVGGVAVGIPISPWLLGFSGFVFLSLAFTKRYTELQRGLRDGVEKAHGRGYVASDLPIVGVCGVAAGFAAVLVLSLYLNSDTVRALYRTAPLLWVWLPAVLYWLCRVWMLAHRGQLHDDPVVFAARDPVTYLLAALVLGALALAATVEIPALTTAIR